MSFEILNQLPSPREIKEKYPLSEELKAIKAKRDEEITKIITGEDQRLLLIIGPCSADSEEPVIDYVKRLAVMQEQVKDQILIVPRIYTN